MDDREGHWASDRVLLEEGGRGQVHLHRGEQRRFGPNHSTSGEYLKHHILCYFGTTYLSTVGSAPEVAMTTKAYCRRPVCAPFIFACIE